MTTKTEKYINGVIMRSFTMPDGPSDRNVALTEEACKKVNDELHSAATKAGQVCRFSFEVVRGLENVRVNLFGARDKDVLLLGYYYCQLQRTNP